MKRILTTSLAALCTSLAMAEEKTTTTTSTATSATAGAGNDVKVSTNTDGDGKATITIEVNGRKEVRVLDLKKPVTSTFSIATSGSPKKTPATWLGVASDELSEELSAQLPVSQGTGVIVRHVAENSPAAKVGIQKHDILLKFDDQIITDGRQLQKLVRSRKTGDVVELTLLRKGQEQKLKATLEENAQADEYGWGADLPVIDIGAGKVAVQDLLRTYTEAAGAAGARGNIIITSPDGKVVTNLDTGDLKIAPLLRKADQALRDSNISTDLMKRLEEAIAEVRTNAQRAGDEAVKAMKQAEDAARRAADAARRAEEKVERDQEQSAPEKKAPQGQ